MAIIVSSLIRTHSPWRYLFPLQSYSQAFSYAITMVVGLTAAAVALNLLDPAAPLLTVLLGSAAGGSVALYGVLPGKMYVRDRSTEAVRIIHQYMATSSYRYIQPCADGYRYITGRWPLLWWRENHITITLGNHSELAIEGPMIGLLQLKTVLLRSAR